MRVFLALLGAVCALSVTIGPLTAAASPAARAHGAATVAVTATATASPSPTAIAPGQLPPAVFAVVVGQNDGWGVLPDLRYADDDALRFYRLMRRLAPPGQLALLTELDLATWRGLQSLGEAAPPMLPPSRLRLREVIAHFKARIGELRRQQPGRRIHLFFFYSGHGERGYFFLKRHGESTAEASFSGDDLLAAFGDSTADLTQLFIDACKSQSLFVDKGRGDDELGPDFTPFLQRLAPRPGEQGRLGVITSTVADAPAGEARDLGAGYFSHVLVSGLSGAADADGDGVVRYGELASFVVQNTRGVSGQRPWFRPPAGGLDAEVVSLRGRDDLLLLGADVAGHLLVLDQGSRTILLELHKGGGRPLSLLLPPGRYLVARVEAERGYLAEAVADGRHPTRLTAAHFDRAVSLGRPFGERGPQAAATPAPLPPPTAPALPSPVPPSAAPPSAAAAQPSPAVAEMANDNALARFEPSRSGFSEPFTPESARVLRAGFEAGLAVATPPARRQALRRFAGASYAVSAAPTDRGGISQEVSAFFGHRVGSRLLLLGRATFAFSSHRDFQGAPFRLSRLMLEGAAELPLVERSRLALSLSAAAAWQVVLVTREVVVVGESSGHVTSLYGDPAAGRFAAAANLRLRVAGGFWLGLSAGYAIDLIHQRSSVTTEGSRLHVFGEPLLRLEALEVF